MYERENKYRCKENKGNCERRRVKRANRLKHISIGYLRHRALPIILCVFIRDIEERIKQERGNKKYYD